jgi:hypothetical protein
VRRSLELAQALLGRRKLRGQRVAIPRTEHLGADIGPAIAGLER